MRWTPASFVSSFGGGTVVVAWLCLALTSAQAQSPDPQAVLTELLTDPARADAAWIAMQSTGDEQLQPLLVALCESPQSAQRAFAAAALAEIFEDQPEAVAGVLLRRLKEDTDKIVRITSMARLLSLKAISVTDLQEVLTAEDKEIRCMAADALVRQGHGASALSALEVLTGESDPVVAGSACLSLTAMGREHFFARVEKILHDPTTDEMILAQLLTQIGQQKILPALPLAAELADDTTHSEALRMKAYWAIADADPNASAILAEAFGRSDDVVWRINLLHMLSSRDDAQGYLRQIAGTDDFTARLAEFELARAGGADITAAVQRALHQPHPVVVDYILERAEQDLQSNPSQAACYAAPLLRILRAKQSNATRITEEHFRLARTAEFLVNLGTPPALEGLSQILATPYNGTVRAVAAGLLRANNPAACALARDLLHSPYEELSCDAALVLGRFGDPAAQPMLEKFIDGRRKQPAPLMALSCWYLLKIRGQSTLAANQLAAELNQAGQ